VLSVSERGPGRGRSKGLQSPACCVLTERDMRGVMEVLVHECKGETWYAVGASS
jgi:hypothetical protein